MIGQLHFDEAESRHYFKSRQPRALEFDVVIITQIIQPDDLITRMLNLREPYAMSDDEIRSTAVLLVIAGYDTTAKTLGNVLLALEQNPDQRRDVVEHPDLVPAAIEEAIPAPVLTTALYERFSSRGEADFQNKLLSAMRYEFGGHLEKPGGS